MLRTNDTLATTIEETGRETANMATKETAVSHGRATATIPMTRIATRITTEIDVPMETRIEAQEVTATTPLLGKGRTSSTATTGTTGDIGPITTGIWTQNEDVQMSSIPATTREGTALLRTSGGCRITDHKVRLGRNITTGPSTLTNLLR